MRKAIVIILSCLVLRACATNDLHVASVKVKDGDYPRVTDCDGLEDSAFIACTRALIGRLETIENASVTIKLLSEKDAGTPGMICRSDYVMRTYRVCRHDLCEDVRPPLYYEPSLCTVWGERAFLFLMSFLSGAAAARNSQ